MDQLISRFLTKLGIKDQTPFSNCFFANLASEKDINRLLAVIQSQTLLPVPAYRELFQKIDELRNSPYGFDTRLSFAYKDETLGLHDFVDSFIQAYDAYQLGDYYVDKANKTLVFTYANENDKPAAAEELKEFNGLLKQISSHLVTVLKAKVVDPELTEDSEAVQVETPVPNEPVFVDDIAINDDASLNQGKPESGDEDEEEEDDDGPSAQEMADFEKADRERQLADAKRAAKLFQQQKAEWEQRQEDERTYYPSALKDIDNLKKVLVTGTIFKRGDEKGNIRVTRKGKHFLPFEYTDGTDSVQSILFESKRFPVDFLESLKVGTKIKVKGMVTKDKFSNQIAISPDAIKILDPDPLREDPSPDKRIELHLHTKMSAMDAVSSITDYARLAKHFGMPAIGLSDHGVVQAFPEAQKAGKKFGLKMLYGCELYMVDSKLDICLNPKSILLSSAEYVVFDLETTGLSAAYDRIIEFGATKYSHGQRTDEIDFFINPDRKLRDFIMQKTNITQAMADSGRPIKEALKTILEYFGDAVIIDHNAAFDIGFLNEALRKNGLPTIKNPVIDTLPLSRFMFPKQRSHTLEAVASTLNIFYDETKVHRAIYDAEVLEAVWLGLESRLSQTNPDLNMMDLVNLTSDDVILSARPKHVIAYAKNAQGIKDLYKIISLSSTKYLADVPHTPRFLIDENRSNLLIGSACMNGEVFDAALTRSKDVLEKTMAWYDYIEVQPPACYSWKINMGEISSEEDLEMILKDLISAAEEVKKPVVATSDCHYLNPSDKLYRDVFISAKGLKGTFHPLNPNRRKKLKPFPNPDQHFLSTQEMKDAFAFLHDDALVDRIVVTNTHWVADQLEELKPIKDRLYPPHIANCDHDLRALCYETAHKLYGDPLPKPIEDRLETELKGIIGNGYTVIYWIASILVRQVNAAGHLVGSRGSVGSSLVATMSGITEVNPLPPFWLCPNPDCKHLEWADPKKYNDGFDLPDRVCPKCGTKMKKDGHNIPFETFLGFHADKVPDIDLNFPSDFQAQAHEMTRKLMGAKNVFKAGTIQGTEEKNAIGYVKGYLESKNVDLRTIRNAEIDRIAHGCIGVKRTTSQHPGGIIVIPDDMSVFDFTPYQYPANSEDASWLTTQYDFRSIHDNVLKFDELGHVDPYAIKMMCDMAKIDWKSIPFDDLDTLSVFYSTKALHLKQNILRQKTGALGLPEFGTSLARKILEETKPKGYGDLVRISGLSHGTGVFQGNAEDLILSGKATLQDVIGCRDDIMVQLHDRFDVPSDQAFTIMELVRHGQFTKPGFEEKTQKAMDVMKAHRVSDDYIASCAKIQYLFPKGHACAYVMMAVRVAWFKVHRPEVYYATFYTLRCDAYDLRIMQKGQRAALAWLQSYQNKMAQHLHVENREKALNAALTVYVEMTDRGIPFGKLSVFKSAATMFTVDPKTKAIIPPFTAVDSLGESIAKAIVAEREKRPFTSIEDFENRCKVPSAISKAIRDLGGYEGLPESNQMSLFDCMGN